MPVYHQMGFNSNNLVDLPEMSEYRGAIFSPINETQDGMVDQIASVSRSKGGEFEIIFDPQMYVPATERGKLKEWAYFPKDVDTADYSSHKWWASINSKLAQSAGALNAQGLCSPVVIPKIFNDGFYSLCLEIAQDLKNKLVGRRVRLFQTLLVSASDLTGDNRAHEIASIVSRTKCEQIYLVFITNVEPRRELSAVDEITGAMRLIRLLESAGLPVLVGFCSSDLILWKAAGASSCASGKFFNLRRFTRQRFEEPKATGGGQLPYWFEESLLAFMREQDLLLLRKHDALSPATSRSPFGQAILAKLDKARQTGKKEAWLADSWKHFLCWFADVERRLQTGTSSAEDLLKTADANWSKLEKARILMVERSNDGSWIRSWLNGMNGFSTMTGDH
jgi:hypothetical protein